MVVRVVSLIASAFFGAIVLLGVLYVVQNDTESTTRVYGDWKLSCPPKKAVAQGCSLTQDVLQRGTGTTLVHLQMMRADVGNRLLIVVPVGVLLEPGLGLAIGDTPLRVLQYKTCDANGCIVALQMDHETSEALSTANSGGIAVVAGNGKRVDLPFSPKGLADGVTALGWEAFKRSSALGPFLP